MCPSISPFLNWTPNFKHLLMTISASLRVSSTVSTCWKSSKVPSREMLWNITWSPSIPIFSPTMPVNWRLFKEYSTIRNQTHQLWGTCQKMPVKLFGQSTCIRKLQDQSLSSLKMWSTPLKSRNTTETTTLWVKCLPSMKCGIMISGWRKSKDQKQLYKQL